MMVFADIISNKSNDLIPGAKAYSDDSAAIRFGKRERTIWDVCGRYYLMVIRFSRGRMFLL